MFELVVSTFTTLFVTIDPIGVLPLFVAIAAPMGRDISRKLATRSVLIATLILMFFAVAGNAVLETLHISLDAFRISGGILLLVIAIQMVFEQRTKKREERSEKALKDHGQDAEAEAWGALAIFPLAIPLLAGPGAMTSLLLLSAEFSWTDQEYWLVLATLLAIMIFAWALFWLGSGFAQFMSPQITLLMTRVLGVILAALAVEFIISGVRGAFGLAV